MKIFQFVKRISRIIKKLDKKSKQGLSKAISNFLKKEEEENVDENGTLSKANK